MTVSGRMTMQAVVERNTAVDTLDGWHNPVPPNWVLQDSKVSCYAWETPTPGGRKTVDDRKVATMMTLRMMTSLQAVAGTDPQLRDSDRIVRIEDRREQTLFDGPFVIDGRKRLDTHLEWELGEGRVQ